LRRYGNVEEPAPADALDVNPFVLVWRAELAILRGGATQSDMGMGNLWMWSDMAWIYGEWLSWIIGMLLVLLQSLLHRPTITKAIVLVKNSNIEAIFLKM